MRLDDHGKFVMFVGRVIIYKMILEGVLDKIDIHGCSSGAFYMKRRILCIHDYKTRICCAIISIKPFTLRFK